ncbi:DUF1257 domain-containing protein (plasmid) [Paenibacillus rhizovicinus]|uniref:DUF1257 domain-containing protein n=1 Tax=Paenibacillus rhizovicinus TaxID=2704463 RepID=A0A6C0PBM5_9BACL|nr:DUF1257 domain-containing protein [Paenibacillus rhizovicinus]QHW35765.1 DUF1257 domain-containing protein [Paenibacillus rhizovicinus]
MSHFKAFACKVDSVEFVKKALQEMNLGYKENCQIEDWAHQKRNVVLGVVKDGKLVPLGFAQEEGELKLYADWFMTGFSEKQFTEKVAQLHDKHKAIDVCEQNGWSVDMDSLTTNEAGEIEFLATSWA